MSERLKLGLAVLILLRVWILNDRKWSVIKSTGLFYLTVQLVSVGYAIAIMVKATGTGNPTRLYRTHSLGWLVHRTFPF